MPDFRCMVNLILLKMRIGGTFFTMKIFLYIIVLSALMTILPQLWHAPVHSEWDDHLSLHDQTSEE